MDRGDREVIFMCRPAYADHIKVINEMFIFLTFRTVKVFLSGIKSHVTKPLLAHARVEFTVERKCTFISNLYYSTHAPKVRLKS